MASSWPFFIHDPAGHSEPLWLVRTPSPPAFLLLLPPPPPPACPKKKYLARRVAPVCKRPRPVTYCTRQTRPSYPTITRSPGTDPNKPSARRKRTTGEGSPWIGSPPCRPTTLEVRSPLCWEVADAPERYRAGTVQGLQPRAGATPPCRKATSRPLHAQTASARSRACRRAYVCPLVEQAV